MVQNRSIRVFLCFRGVQLERTVPFSQPKMSQNLYCVPLVAHHEWESFVPMKFFYTSWYKKSFISTKPLRIL